MEENSLHDKKSLTLVQGNKADWKELAKDCVCFANGAGGIISIGIEDEDDLPPPDQVINPKLIDEINKKVSGLTLNVGIAPIIEIASNGGEYIKL